MKTKLEYVVQFKYQDGVIDEFKVSAENEFKALNVADKKRKETTIDNENWIVSKKFSIVILLV